MSVRPVRGKSPWAASTTAEVPYDQPAPRQLVPYQCERGHEFTLPLAAGAELPAAWNCRCGTTAALIDTAPATATPARPRRVARGEAIGALAEHERCVRMLFERRSPAELEALLAERLAGMAERRADSRWL